MSAAERPTAAGSAPGWLARVAPPVAGRLRALSRLQGPFDAVMLARVVAVAAAVPILARLPLPRQAAILAPPRRRRARSLTPGEVETVVRCLEVAQAVGRPLVRRGCLTRGVTLYWFVGRWDDTVELCFGLGRPGGAEEYAGHCWLTRDGQPYLERVDPAATFDAVYRIPPSPSPDRRAG